MEFGIEIGAAIGDDDDAIVRIGSLQQSCENYSAGRYSEDDESVDVFCAEDHFQIGAGESANAMFDDENVVGSGAEGWMNCAGCSLKEILVRLGGFDRGEEFVAIAYPGKPGRKPN